MHDHMTVHVTSFWCHCNNHNYNGSWLLQYSLTYNCLVFKQWIGNLFAKVLVIPVLIGGIKILKTGDK